MEIKRLPFGQSHADKIRAAHYKWVNMPPGIPPDMAIDFMERLKAGSTIGKLTGGGKRGPPMVSYDRFKKHCELHPDWAVEARRISQSNVRILKGLGAQRRKLIVQKTSLMLPKPQIIKTTNLRAQTLSGRIAGRADIVFTAVNEAVSLPYRQGQGDGAVLDAIYAIDRSGELKELSHLSPVVAALKKFEVYRIYYRESDEATKKALDDIIGGYCHA
jgi:hypothetical protein